MCCCSNQWYTVIFYYRASLGSGCISPTTCGIHLIRRIWGTSLRLLDIELQICWEDPYQDPWISLKTQNPSSFQVISEAPVLTQRSCLYLPYTLAPIESLECENRVGIQTDSIDSIFCGKKGKSHQYVLVSKSTNWMPCNTSTRSGRAPILTYSSDYLALLQSGGLSLIHVKGPSYYTRGVPCLISLWCTSNGLGSHCPFVKYIHDLVLFLLINDYVTKPLLYVQYTVSEPFPSLRQVEPPRHSESSFEFRLCN